MKITVEPNQQDNVVLPVIGEAFESLSSGNVFIIVEVYSGFAEWVARGLCVHSNSASDVVGRCYNINPQSNIYKKYRGNITFEF